MKKKFSLKIKIYYKVKVFKIQLILIIKIIFDIIIFIIKRTPQFKN